MGRHRPDSRGTLYRSRVYGQRGRLVWMSIVLPVMLLAGLATVTAAVLVMTGHANLGIYEAGRFVRSALAAPILMLAGGMATAMRGRQPGISATPRGWRPRR